MDKKGHHPPGADGRSLSPQGRRCQVFHRPAPSPYGWVSRMATSSGMRVRLQLFQDIPYPSGIGSIKTPYAAWYRLCFARRDAQIEPRILSDRERMSSSTSAVYKTIFGDLRLSRGEQNSYCQTQSLAPSDVCNSAKIDEVSSYRSISKSVASPLNHLPLIMRSIESHSGCLISPCR